MFIGRRPSQAPDRLDIPPELTRAHTRRQTLTMGLLAKGPPPVKRKSLDVPEVGFKKKKDHVKISLENITDGPGEKDLLSVPKVWDND